MKMFKLTLSEWIGLALIVIFTALTPVMFGSGDAYYTTLVAYTITFTLFAIAMYVMYAWAGEIPLGLGLFYGLGAYASAWMMKSLELDFLLAVAGAIVLSVVVALVIGLITLRLTGAYFAIVSWGLSAVAVVGANVAEDVTGGALGLFGIPPATFGGLSLTDPVTYLAVAETALIVVLLILILVRATRFGAQLTAVRLNARLSRSLGINVFRTKVVAFALSAAFAALSGALGVTYTKIVVPSSLSISISVEGLAIVLLGGTGFLLGPVVGSLFFKLLPEEFQFPAEVRELLFGVLIVLIITIAPRGLPELLGKLKALLRRDKKQPDEKDMSPPMRRDKSERKVVR